MDSNCVGVVGLGFLGRGIVACLLGNGVNVVAFDSNQSVFDEVLSYLSDAVREMVEHGVEASEGAPDWRQRLRCATDIHELAPCSFIIESVFEDLAAKRLVFHEVEAVVGEDVPIASNTSALPIGDLQRHCRHPARLLGMHWAEPAYATRFLEVIQGELTSESALQAAVALGRRVGKDPCIVRQDIPGFIANRLGYALYREAANLLELGVADVETIDRAFSNACGLWATLCGPFRWMDITGGPSLYARAMSGVLPTLNSSGELPTIFAKKLLDEERGVIDGKGFYAYEPGDAERWQALLHEHAWSVKQMQDRYRLLSETENPSS